VSLVRGISLMGFVPAGLTYCLDTANDGTLDSTSSAADLSHISQHEDTVPASNVQMPGTVFYTSGAVDPVEQMLNTAADTLTSQARKSSSDTLDVSGRSSCGSSVFSVTPGSRSEENLAVVHEGCDAPPPADERIAERKHERRYRILLSHQFHPSRGCWFLFSYRPYRLFFY
jgi:hypothetical protein